MSHNVLIMLTVSPAILRALTHLALHIAGPNACRYLGTEGEEIVRTQREMASSKENEYNTMSTALADALSLSQTYHAPCLKPGWQKPA